jgi:hypothetical protein
MGNPMIDTRDDLRLALAGTLRPGDRLQLGAAGGALVDVQIERLDGVDFRVRIEGGLPLPVGSLLSGRLHDGIDAWYCTFIALDGSELPDGARTIELRLGDADRIATERWSERRRLSCPALVRREDDGTVLRGAAVDGSAVGVAVTLREGDLPAGVMVGVTLAGAGGGGIAFRGLVRRRTWAQDGRLFGIEVVDISADDRRRLERALGSSAS